MERQERLARTWPTREHRRRTAMRPATEQAIQFRLKRDDAAGCPEEDHEAPRDQGDQQMDLKNQPAHVSILRAREPTSYSRPTPSASATRLM